MFLVDWPGGDWETTARYALIIFLIYLAAIWLTLVFWTYRDIRQRSRDPIVQALSVLLVLVFFLPGHWLYLIVRPRHTLIDIYERSLEEEALLQELEDQKACPTCRRRVLDEYLICPSCRTQLKEACRACGRPLGYAWLACPYCGLDKAPRDAAGPRPARVSAVRANEPLRAPAAAAAGAPPPPPRVAAPAAVNRPQPVAPITVRHHAPAEASNSDSRPGVAETRPEPVPSANVRTAPEPAAAFAAPKAEPERMAPNHDGNGASARPSPFATPRPVSSDGRREPVPSAQADHARPSPAAETRLADQPISPQAAEAARAKLRPHHTKSDDGPVIGAASDD